jgi:hypothetical protein
MPNGTQQDASELAQSLPVVVAVKLADAKPECAHHYVLSAPQNDLVVGRCKRCQATKEWVADPDPENWSWGRRVNR